MDFIDTHAHIYPDAIALKAAQSIAEFYQIPTKEDGRLETLLERGRQAGIVKHLVHSVGITPERVPGINDYLMRTVAAHPDRLVGFGTLHPDMENLRGEIRRIRAGGLRGVKVHPDFSIFAWTATPRLRCSAPSRTRACRCWRTPGTPLPLQRAGAHGPRPESRAAGEGHLRPSGRLVVWDDAWKQLADLPNVWVDTCSSLYALTPGDAAAIIRHYEGSRVFFGTDYPMWDPVEERARFDASP